MGLSKGVNKTWLLVFTLFPLKQITDPLSASLAHPSEGKDSDALMGLTGLEQGLLEILTSVLERTKHCPNDLREAGGHIPFKYPAQCGSGT